MNNKCFNVWLSYNYIKEILETRSHKKEKKSSKVSMCEGLVIPGGPVPGLHAPEMEEKSGAGGGEVRHLGQRPLLKGRKQKR